MNIHWLGNITISVISCICIIICLFIQIFRSRSWCTKTRKGHGNLKKKRKKKKKEAKTAVHRYNECPTLPSDKYLQTSRICNSFPRFIQCSLHTQTKSCAYINFRSKMKKKKKSHRVLKTGWNNQKIEVLFDICWINVGACYN